MTWNDGFGLVYALGAVTFRAHLHFTFSDSASEPKVEVEGLSGVEGVDGAVLFC